MHTLNDIVELLDYSEEDYWKRYFLYQSNRINNQEPIKEVCLDLIKIFQGGMGSFSDLVLHKNSKPLIDENNRLEELKDLLFELCEDEIY
jgi:hypothetical protein